MWIPTRTVIEILFMHEATADERAVPHTSRTHSQVADALIDKLAAVMFHRLDLTLIA
jgi:hypothetical protein